MTTIHTRLLAVQKNLQLMPSQIARKLGISEQEYLKTIMAPSETFIQRFCSRFGIAYQYLAKGVGPMFSEYALPAADILAFRDARNWKQFHTPKDLSISLTLEAAELPECFQWSGSDVDVKQKQAQMEDELADILIYSVLFADAIDADIPTIIKNKLKKNGEKYNVSDSFGNAKKYTEFSETE